MEQKIFDIIPPQISKRQKLRLEERGKAPTALITEDKRRFFKNRFLIPLILLILIGAGSYFFVEPQAEIEIWLKTKKLDFKTQIAIDESLSLVPEPDMEIIPGEIIETEKMVSQKFSSSEAVVLKNKAKGTIRVYNNYSTYHQPLIAQTRFMSDSGKVFMTPERITVPGKKLESGKWVPGFVDIEVVAAEAGSDYNIPPSTFSIPGLKGDPSYTFFYAKSFEYMEGGSKTEIHRVTEDDLKKAEETLYEKALLESKNSLINELSEDLILMEDLIKSEIVEVFPLAEAGQELESFMVQVKAKSRGLVFKKSELNQFAEDYVLANLEQGYKVVPQSLITTYSPVLPGEITNKDLEKAGTILNLDLSVKTYSEVNLEDLKRQALGKDAIQIERDIIKSFSEVNEVGVKFWPFWVRKAPLNIEDIEINLNFED